MKKNSCKYVPISLLNHNVNFAALKCISERIITYLEKKINKIFEALKIIMHPLNSSYLPSRFIQLKLTFRNNRDTRPSSRDVNDVQFLEVRVI